MGAAASTELAEAIGAAPGGVGASQASRKGGKARASAKVQPVWDEGEDEAIERKARQLEQLKDRVNAAIASGSRVKQLLEDEVRRDMGLSAIRLRFTGNGALEHCSLFSEAGGRHICNQDSMIAWEDFNVPEIAGRVKGRMPPGAASDVIFCAVFDGHGPNGHLVSQRVRDSLPSRIASLLAPPPVATVSPYGHLDKCAPPMAPASDQLLQRLGVNGGSSKSKGASGKVHPLGVAPAYGGGGDGGMTLQRSRSANSLENFTPRGPVSPYHSSSSSASPAAAAAAAAAAEASREASKAQVERAFRRAFLEMDDELRSHPHVDGHVSGSTAVVAALLGRRLVVASIGDSRAVLAYRCKAGHAVPGTAASIGGMQCKPLTNDHKCSVASERKRIEQAGGRVQASEHEPGNPRIWLPRERSPGLVPSRAFGDFVVKDYGVIAEPDILIRHLTSEDEFIILATDGLWDVMTPQEAMSAVLAAPTRQTAARHLVARARSIWAAKHQSEGNEEAFDDTASMGTVCTEASFGTVIYSEADYKPSGTGSAEVESNSAVVLTPPVCEDGFYRDDTIRVPVERQAEGREKENMGNGDGVRLVLGSMGQGMSSQDSSSNSIVSLNGSDSKVVKQGGNVEGKRSVLGLFYNGEVAASVSASAYASLSSSKVVPLPPEDHSSPAPGNSPGKPPEKAPGNPPVTITICSADGKLVAPDARVMAPPMRSRSLTALSGCIGGGMGGTGGTGGMGMACMDAYTREDLGSENSSSCTGGNGYGCTNTRAVDRYVSLESGVAVEAGGGAEDGVGSKWGGKWGSAWESSGAGCGEAVRYAVARLAPFLDGALENPFRLPDEAETDSNPHLSGEYAAMSRGTAAAISSPWDADIDSQWERYTSLYPSTRAANLYAGGGDANDADEYDSDSDRYYTSRFSLDSNSSDGSRVSSSGASCWEAELACDPVWVDDARSRIRNAALAVVETQQAVAAANWMNRTFEDFSHDCPAEADAVCGCPAAAQPCQHDELAASYRAKYEPAAKASKARRASFGSSAAESNRSHAKKGFFGKTSKQSGAEEAPEKVSGSSSGAKAKSSRKGLASFIAGWM
ncbi:unnamed protein product [Closterium sp. Yama58-4]|nr:unnamed protein product [Closterium sp. Yama58-4]